MTCRFKAETSFPHWITDTAYVYTDQDSSLMAHDVSDDRHWTVIPAEVMKKYNVEYVQFSPDGVRALLQSEVQTLFKYSERSMFRVYNLKTKAIWK
jgi:hypothetical protein